MTEERNYQHNAMDNDTELKHCNIIVQELQANKPNSYLIAIYQHRIEVLTNQQPATTVY